MEAYLKGNIVDVNRLPGCINGETVYKKITTYDTGCEEVLFVDNAGAEISGTGWAGGDCGAGAPTTRYDREILCDPTTGDRVHVRMEYLTNGTVNATTAFMLDGVTPYAGAINALVSCSGKEQFDYESSIVYDNCVAVVQTIVHDADDTGAVATIIYTNLDGTAHAFVGPLTAEPCDAITERIEQNLMPVDAVGNPVGTVVKEIRTYTNGVVATAYQDTVTGAVVALPAGTIQLVEENALQKEPMYMCDNGTTTFLRHIVYNHGIGSLLSFDTGLDGTTPYVPVGVVTANACPIPAGATPTIVGHETLLTNGVIPAGKNSVSFVGIEGLNGTMMVNGAEIRTGESLTFSTYFNPVTNEYKSVPAIPYSVMAPSILRVNYID